jgi:hypothetical protein
MPADRAAAARSALATSLAAASAWAWCAVGTGRRALGVHQNYAGDRTEPMPELYGRSLAESAAPAWDFSSWLADAGW